MQTAWLMTMFTFTVAFFLVVITIYFFRPKKENKMIQDKPERQVLDPENIVLPHRVEPGWPATIETSSGQTAEGKIASITHGSGFIESPVTMAIGEKFQLTIHLPEREPIQLRAEVTWSNLHLPPEKVLNRGLGIRFIEAGEEAICLINDTIAQHASTLANPEKKMPSETKA